MAIIHHSPDPNIDRSYISVKSRRKAAQASQVSDLDWVQHLHGSAPQFSGEAAMIPEDDDDTASSHVDSSDDCDSIGTAQESHSDLNETLKSLYGDRDWQRETLEKPPHSYAMLIYLAIRHNGGGKVALAQIYDYILSNFGYYRIADPGWKNSIRHNLTQHKCFLKIARSAGESGKGGFWALDKSYETMFQTGDFKGAVRRMLSRNSDTRSGGGKKAGKSTSRKRQMNSLSLTIKMQNKKSRSPSPKRKVPDIYCNTTADKRAIDSMMDSDADCASSDDSRPTSPQVVPSQDEFCFEHHDYLDMFSQDDTICGISSEEVLPYAHCPTVLVPAIGAASVGEVPNFDLLESRISTSAAVPIPGDEEYISICSPVDLVHRTNATRPLWAL